jgi:hypothetical protein
LGPTPPDPDLAVVLRRPFDPRVTHIAAWLAQRGGSLHPDRKQADRFLRALDPDAGFFSFRTFSETPYTRLPGRDPLERAIHGSLASCWDELVALNRAGAAISVTVNATNGKGRAPGDIVRVRALFVDDDHPERRPDGLLPRAHISVQSSPGRFHHYWRVRDVSPQAFRRLQCRLAERFGTDHRVSAPNQSMALPGFWRRKSALAEDMTRLQAVAQLPALGVAEIGARLGVRDPGP